MKSSLLYVLLFSDKIGHIAKGTQFVIGIYNLHRNPEWWGPDANEFNPDHFHPDRASSRHSFAFLPFHGGPRMCIGAQYAILSIKVGLIVLLSQFRFETSLKMEDLKFKYTITLGLQNGHMVRMYQRNQPISDVRRMPSEARSI